MSILALIHLGLALGSSAFIIPRAENEPRFLSYPIVHRKRDARLAGRDTEVTLHNQSVTTYLFERTKYEPAPCNLFLDCRIVVLNKSPS